MKNPFFSLKNLRKPVILFLMVPLTGILAGCAGLAAGNSENHRYVPGVYEGIGEGRRGPVHILVRLDTEGIVEIEIIDHGEDTFLGLPAMEELLEAVLAENSTDLDAVSGATESSQGFLAAVEDALAQAEESMK
jgi:uncharacterized protein with FMN-binding domain